jgi:type 1 glutamine amidotransferase
MARLLVYTRTTGYRHASIPAGIAALRGLDGYSVDATEDPDVFRPGPLRAYAAIVFLSTSGDVLDDAGREALTGYVTAGGSWLGIHGASTTEYGWPWFGELAGARFDQHPPVQPGVITVADKDHPATEQLGPTWTRRDEWYAFTDNPRPRVRVLLTVDEASYEGGTMGADHPIAWCHERLGGRSFYTALGHTDESFAEPAFLGHLRGALSWLTQALRSTAAP